jgi:hypothetical protein
MVMAFYNPGGGGGKDLMTVENLLETCSAIIYF